MGRAKNGSDSCRLLHLPAEEDSSTKREKESEHLLGATLASFISSACTFSSSQHLQDSIERGLWYGGSCKHRHCLTGSSPDNLPANA